MVEHELTHTLSFWLTTYSLLHVIVEFGANKAAKYYRIQPPGTSLQTYVCMYLCTFHFNCESCTLVPVTCGACMAFHTLSLFPKHWQCSVTRGSGVEGVVSCIDCIQDDRHVMWNMLTGNEVACTCLYMHSAVNVGTSKGMCVCTCACVCVHMWVHL